MGISVPAGAGEVVGRGAQRPPGGSAILPGGRRRQARRRDAGRPRTRWVGGSRLTRCPTRPPLLSRRSSRACRGLPGGPDDRVPVWFMRQAGRSLPEYRAVRGEGSILDAIADPELAAEITLQPVRRYGVDAAILYSDIVVPVHAIGFGVDVAPGVGPVVEQPFRSAADLERLRPLDPEADTPYVLETVRILATRARGSPHRLRRRAVHGRQLPDRGPALAHLRPDQGAHATATRPCGTP